MRHHALGNTLRLAMLTISATAPAAASAQERVAAAWVGDYSMSQMEAVAGLRLHADGTFDYGLTVGSLDERAQGRWQATGDRVVLTSVPRPKPPTVVAGTVEANPGKPFLIRLLGPGGKDVPGVDFRLEFDAGDPLDDYTPGGLWSLPEGERRTPKFVTFSMRQYRLKSARLPINALGGRTVVFELIPNDFGVADLTGTYAVRQGNTLTLYREEGEMTFRRIKR